MSLLELEYAKRAGVCADLGLLSCSLNVVCSNARANAGFFEEESIPELDVDAPPKTCDRECMLLLIIGSVPDNMEPWVSTRLSCELVRSAAHRVESCTGLADVAPEKVWFGRNVPPTAAVCGLAESVCERRGGFSLFGFSVLSFATFAAAFAAFSAFSFASFPASLSAVLLNLGGGAVFLTPPSVVQRLRMSLSSG